jgi:hypothetical protein
LLKLSLKTKSNLEFTFSTIKEVNVLPPGTYPEVNPNPIKAADFSQKLEGKAGKAISQITLKAPSRTSGEICFDALQVRNDPKPSRISKFKAAIDGKDLTGQQCFSLNPGQDKKVQLTVENKDSADGIASGFINTTLKSDGKSAVKDKLGIEIPTTTKINIILAILIFALLLLAGVAIPLALMYLLNSINARLRLRNLYYAQIPVKLDASGNFVTLRRNDDSKSSEIFQGDDFRPFSSGEQRQKSLQIGAIKLEGKAPRNPFGNVTGLLTANPGTVITSNQIQSIKNPQSYQATGSLNPANMMYLTLTESALENLKKKNDGDHQITQTIEGEISTFVDLTSGAGEIVQELNMRDTGWINKILNIAPTLPPVEKIKRTKPQKKESAQVTAQAPTPTSNTDDWGTSPTTKGTPKDDWDSPSGGSSSNNDGWGDSSGSSGGKKNDDW